MKIEIDQNEPGKPILTPGTADGASGEQDGEGGAASGEQDGEE